MIKELMHDPLFLAVKSDSATKDDLQVAVDLLDIRLQISTRRASCLKRSEMESLKSRWNVVQTNLTGVIKYGI